MPATDSILIFVRQPAVVTPPVGAIPNLKYYGGAVITDLTYKTFFVGSIWRTAYLAGEAARLDAALQAALSSADCNEVFAQYVPPGPKISASGSHDTLDTDWKEVFYSDDLKMLAQTLLNDASLPTSGLDNFALALVLPPGAILSADPSAGTIPQGYNSMEGLAGYHGQFELDQADGTKLQMYFCVSVWSDGSNGAAVPADANGAAWAPWENTCATLYHELSEVRMCPNIDSAPNHNADPPLPDLGWLVWYGSQEEEGEADWQEIADLSILWAGALPQKVFCKGTIQGASVPIQALWSNQSRLPFIPKGFTPQRSW